MSFPALQGNIEVPSWLLPILTLVSLARTQSFKEPLLWRKIVPASQETAETAGWETIKFIAEKVEKQTTPINLLFKKLICKNLSFLMKKLISLSQKKLKNI